VDIEGHTHLDWGGVRVVHLGQMPIAVAESVIESGLATVATCRALEQHVAAFDTWAGLPAKARRFFILLTVCDWDVATAARHLRVSRWRAEAWAAEIRRRLGG
jgi:hypothetical protein